MKNWIQLGGCRKVHGIKGAFKFHLFGGQGSVLKEGMQILLKPENKESSLVAEGQIFRLSKLSLGPQVIATLREVEDRNHAEAILPFEIYLEREQFPELDDDDEFYISDLEGLKVFNHETKEEVGVVSGHMDNGAQIILMIRGKVDIDLPFVEHFFPLIDLENKRIEMIIPEILKA